MPRPPLDLSVYLVTDTALCGGPDGVVTTVRDAVAAGVTVVQLRDPDASEADFIALGRALASELAGTGVPLIVNDRVHLVDVIGGADHRDAPGDEVPGQSEVGAARRGEQDDIDVGKHFGCAGAGMGLGTE